MDGWKIVDLVRAGSEEEEDASRSYPQALAPAKSQRPFWDVPFVSLHCRETTDPVCFAVRDLEARSSTDARSSRQSEPTTRSEES